MDTPDISPYPGFDKTGQYLTPRKAPRVRQEAEEFAARNAGSINLFNKAKETFVPGPMPSPRCITYEAKQNYEKNKGQLGSLLGGDGPGPEPESPHAPR